ncbi:hypothetical protein [Phenylobacterium sp.]|jgi:hypothetical protein|uniref:hypothetical protein n=1 Tax=Phenylobacterium sp. TaxID=1871053 RepID=UPI002F3FBFC0
MITARRLLALSPLKSAAVAALSALAVACSSPPPPPPPAPPPQPPPAPVIPGVSLSAKVVEQAAAYRAYVAHASAISPSFANGDDVAQSLKTGESYEPAALERGAIAYGAVVALQEPSYVAGVRKFVADPDGRRTVAYEIIRNPDYVTKFDGYDQAAGMVRHALGEDGRRILMAGRTIRQSAYDVQHQAWSKADVQGRDARLALAKDLSSKAGVGEVEETARLQSAVGGGAQMDKTSDHSDSPYANAVNHALAVAALAALGYANDDLLGSVMPMLGEPDEVTCLNAAKLNLYQCLAVARPHYEDVFCLGQHALEETGHCLMLGAGVAEPIDPTTKVADASTSKPVKKKRAKSKKR